MAKLNPRFEAYGFTEADSDLVRSFQFAARRAGWPAERIEQAFEWFKAEAPRMAAMPVEARVQSFTEYAQARGWQTRDVESALGWFDTTAAAIERGLAPELPPAPAREHDAARAEEIGALMRTDPGKYWGDVALQDELYEINARIAEGGDDAPAGASAPAAAGAARRPSGGVDRRGEIETMMRDAPGQYWSNTAVQAEYRDLVSGGSPGEAPGAIPGAEGPSSSSSDNAGGGAPPAPQP